MFITNEMEQIMLSVLILDDEATMYAQFVEELNAECNRIGKHMHFAPMQNVFTFREATDCITAEFPDVVLIDGYYGNEMLGYKIANWMHKKYPWMVRIDNSSVRLVENMDYSADKFSEETSSLLRYLRDLPVGIGKFHDPFIYTINDKTLASMSAEELLTLQNGRLLSSFTVCKGTDNGVMNRRASEATTVAMEIRRRLVGNSL